AEVADEQRNEGVAVGTSELLDAFEALDAVSWSSREDFREAMGATLAKSQEDRHVLDVLFERFFFRAVEREASAQGLTEGRSQGPEDRALGRLRGRPPPAPRRRGGPPTGGAGRPGLGAARASQRVRAPRAPRARAAD